MFIYIDFYIYDCTRMYIRMFMNVYVYVCIYEYMYLHEGGTEGSSRDGKTGMFIYMDF
jgi:hypothetical protein